MSAKLLFKMAPGGSFPAQDHFDQRSQIIETFYGGWEGGGGGGRGGDHKTGYSTFIFVSAATFLALYVIPEHFSQLYCEKICLTTQLFQSIKISHLYFFLDSETFRCSARFHMILNL